MTNTQGKIFFACLTMLACLAGCREEAPRNVSDNGQENAREIIVEQVSAPQKDMVAEQVSVPEQQTVAAEAGGKQPPRPPLREDFKGEPQLPLFPRVGEFQPPSGSERFAAWRASIQQLVKVTGVAENQADGSRGWVFRSINTTDALGFFSPIAVKPGRIYQVTFKLLADLPAGASAGIRILEFDEFLWIAEQYTEETYTRHFRGAQEGRRLTGRGHGIQTFAFSTGPETRMVHLFLFREGPHDDNSLMFNDIEIR